MTGTAQLVVEKRIQEENPVFSPHHQTLFENRCDRNNQAVECPLEVIDGFNPDAEFVNLADQMFQFQNSAIESFDTLGYYTQLGISIPK